VSYIGKNEIFDLPVIDKLKLIDIVDFLGCTPLMLAVKFKQYKTVWHLIQQGVDLNFSIYDASALRLAVELGSLEAVKLLVQGMAAVTEKMLELAVQKLFIRYAENQASYIEHVQIAEFLFKQFSIAKPTVKPQLKKLSILEKCADHLALIGKLKADARDYPNLAAYIGYAFKSLIAEDVGKLSNVVNIAATRKF
jgi:hypothetical protein